MDLFGPRRTRAAETSRRADGPASRRADRRSATAQRQERERDAHSNGARAYGTGRRHLPASCPARVLIDDFHHIRHLTAPPPPRFVCMGAPLATCALPKGVCYLLTYLLTYYAQGKVQARMVQRLPSDCRSACRREALHRLDGRACALPRNRATFRATRHDLASISSLGPQRRAQVVGPGAGGGVGNSPSVLRRSPSADGKRLYV